MQWWLGGWVLINLLQAFFSPIDADEAYYWMYAGQLDWGYFDHPPAVAALISLGKDWLPGALGLRLGHVLAGTITVWAIWDLLGKPAGDKGLLAALIIFCQPMLQVYGFIATPDGPLLLFTALLLRQYKSFLHAPTVKSGLIMGVIMAALLYSKYHGVVLILFLILPNLIWLVRQPASWLAVGFGALLYVPHLYWQYAHDFPSFRYHLSGRNDPYKFKYTTEYLLNQLVVFNPFFVYHYIKALAWKPTKSKPPTADERFYNSCRWLIFITLAFFLYSTLNGGTEAQWTAMLCVPMVYVLYQGIERNPQWAKLLKKLAWVSLGIFLLARILLILPQEWLPFSKPFNAKPWVEELENIANGRPVVFENSYRDPSHYQFYAGKEATTFTNVHYRPNQYDIWQNDTLLQGKEVLLVSKDGWNWPASKAFTPQKKRLRTLVVEDFEVAKFLEFTNKAELPKTIQSGQQIPLELYARNRENFTVKLNRSLPLDVYIIYQSSNEKWIWTKLETLSKTSIAPGEPQLLFKGNITVPEGLEKTEQLIHFGAGYRGMPPLRRQSEAVEVIVR